MRSRIQTGQAGEPLTRNIRLLIAFDGTEYHGWQVQANKATVQGSVCDAVRHVTGEWPKLIASGRTDAGVHARRMVANFHTSSHIPAQSLVRALNSILARDIRILSARHVPRSFHARLSARSKVYRYQIYRGGILPPHLAREHFHFPYELDTEVMRQACRLFVGEHDFASFAKHTGRRKDSSPEAGMGTVRRILKCGLNQKGLRLILTFEGAGFLHHMVRNMTGTLLNLGQRRMTLSEFRKLFQERDRRLAGFTAPAHGLVLVRVLY